MTTVRLRGMETRGGDDGEAEGDEDMARVRVSPCHRQDSGFTSAHLAVRPQNAR